MLYNQIKNSSNIVVGDKIMPREGWARLFKVSEIIDCYSAEGCNQRDCKGDKKLIKFEKYDKRYCIEKYDWTFE